ncbi:MAG: hypothetical protein ABSE49_34875 [Polyangiaceae bacterium]|jgi:hypothetical protein
MRFSLLLPCSSLLVLFACGGGTAKPAASEADTSSLEASGSSGATTSGSGSSTTAASADTSAAATGGASTKPAPATAAAATAPPAAVHPVPGATGDIDGKPFSPKLAQLAGPVQKDGRVLILIHEGSDCVADPKSADASMMLMVPWKDGYKTDLSALRRAKGGNLGEAAFLRKKQVSATFKPSGLVTVVSAPTAKDAVGKMKIDLQSGGYILAGDLDVLVCGSP